MQTRHVIATRTSRAIVVAPNSRAIVVAPNSRAIVAAPNSRAIAALIKRVIGMVPNSRAIAATGVGRCSRRRVRSRSVWLRSEAGAGRTVTTLRASARSRRRYGAMGRCAPGSGCGPCAKGPSAI